jgi:hypothetical protein
LTKKEGWGEGDRDGDGGRRYEGRRRERHTYRCRESQPLTPIDLHNIINDQRGKAPQINDMEENQGGKNSKMGEPHCRLQTINMTVQSNL